MTKEKALETVDGDLTAYRAEFPITGRYSFLSHAAISPTSQRVADAVQSHLLRTRTEPYQHYLGDMVALADDLRGQIATLINARSIDEIALMPNTATGINTAAVSLPLRPGDSVLVLDGDYPANIYPWLNQAHRGVLTKIVPQHRGGLDLATLEQRIDPRTRVIALSTAMFATGFRNDIAAVGRLCHERGIFFVVDGIQTLGAFDLDVQGCHIDMLAAGSQKWLLSTPGSGFLYCRQELFEQLVPGAYVGAASVVDPQNYLDYNFTFPPNAERFNTGTINWTGMVALHAALGLLHEVGIARISRRVLHLVETLIADLTGRGYELVASTAPEHRSGIVVVSVPYAEAVNTRLNEQGIIVTARGSGVRIAPHFYNTVEEVLRVGKALDAAQK
jgi:selenocysteine lyase/cysteine desulfurase